MYSLKQFRSLPCPGGIPGHSFWRSVAHEPPSGNFSCAVAFDAHSIKVVAIIKMIFTMRPSATGKDVVQNRLKIAQTKRECLMWINTAIGP